MRIKKGIYSFFNNTTASANDDVLTLDKLKGMIDRINNITRVPAFTQDKLICAPWPLTPARTHRKKRIAKKWLKKYGKRPDTSVDKGLVSLFPGGAMVMYPETHRYFVQEINQINLNNFTASTCG